MSAALAGCVLSEPVQTPDLAPRLEIRNARVLSLPDLAAGYLEIVNSGGGDDRLVRVESPFAAIIQTHETVQEQGVTRMRPHPEGFDVKTGETLRLEPGGKHLMLLDPELPEEGSVPLQLHFQRSGTIEVQARILHPANGF